MTLLSKIHYLQYLQCPKLLWLSVNTPSVIPPVKEAEKARMAEGRKVEEMARQLFDGRLIEHGNGLEATVAESRSALLAPSCGDTLFRAVVQSGRLVAEMDIVLTQNDRQLDIYEVKSGSDIKETYLPDVAFQRYVAEKTGLPMGKCAVITVRTDYVREGRLDVSKMFRTMDVTSEIEPHLATMEANVAEALRVMDLPDCPDVHIGPHCKDCPMAEAPDGCWEKVNAEPCNVFGLYRLQTKRAWGWYGQGFLKSHNIPADYPLTDKHVIQIEAEKTGKPHINRRQITAFYNQVEFPIHFLDFETFASPTPLVDNSSPYEQIPFQFSLHILQNSLDEEPQHVSWIWDAEPQTDPRRQMLAYLKHLLGNGGTIMAYNATFEKAVLKKAAALHPTYGDWVKGILPRFNDLLVPFRGFWLYHPAQHGSCSLKAVLPAWTGKGYGGMAIAGGEQAGREYLRMMFGGTDEEKTRLRVDLEEYCGLDTMGMVELLRVMKRLCPMVAGCS